MRVSLKWLGELITIPETVEELVEKLDLTGTAVEAVHHIGGGLDGVVIGKIVKIEPHPNADTLTYCQVDVGERVAGIVCGAPNIAEGQTVPVALAGAELPSGMKIKKAKIRGVESDGMMCAEDELGLGEDHSGIMILEDGLPLGASFAEALRLADTVLELEVTPNRPDCLSMIGIAREIGAITGRSYVRPEAVVEEVDEPTAEAVTVRIDDPELCPRYGARVIEDVKIQPSPRWMRERLLAAGVRPISNIVDVTNYVMMECGQPLHAFDYEKVAEHTIIVRRARHGEDLVTLDDVDRQLSEDMLLITDPSGPIALAGVMGGASTEISETTTKILLEGATFDPPSISRTSRKLGLLSEASTRFERGADINNVDYALNRAAQLMAETSGGRVLAGIVDEHPKPKSPWTVPLRCERANAVIGAELSAETMADTLRRLELDVTAASRRPGSDATRSDALESGGTLEVTIPTFRPDLEREIDLIEEIARLYGYNEVVSTLPATREKRGGLAPEQRLERTLRRSIESCGVYEAITYSFVDPGLIETLRLPVEADELVYLENPLSPEASVLRPSLLPGLISSALANVNRGARSIALYEIGRVFRAVGEKKPDETPRVGLVATGPPADPSWYEKPSPVDFFSAKGIIETVMTGLNAAWTLEEASHAAYQPGRCAAVICGGVTAGLIGELHPEIAGALEFTQPVAIAELDVGAVLSAVDPVRLFTEVARHPAAVVDLALVVDEGVAAGAVQGLIAQTGGDLLERVALFDVYRGEQIEASKKSLAFELSFRAADRTLTDADVVKLRDRIVGRLAHEVGATVRA
jgi:phenylalanyl-tRNA synthetase beta chain